MKISHTFLVAALLSGLATAEPQVEVDTSLERVGENKVRAVVEVENPSPSTVTDLDTTIVITDPTHGLQHKEQRLDRKLKPGQSVIYKTEAVEVESGGSISARATADGWFLDPQL